MAIFAHPDDESIAAGGLLAMSSAGGATVTLLVATRGEAGPGGACLADLRTREMEAATRVLGASELVWLDYEDGMLASMEAGRMEADLADAIRARQPAVVVTFDSDGLYWHPDHMVLHERVTAAVAGMVEPRPVVWCATMPGGMMRTVAEYAATRGRTRTSILGVDDPDAFGAAAPTPTITLDVSRYATRKLAALACHATQFNGSALAAITPADAPRLLGAEQYRHASDPA